MVHSKEINPRAIFICSTKKREHLLLTNRTDSLYINDNNIYDHDDVHNNISTLDDVHSNTSTFSPHKKTFLFFLFLFYIFMKIKVTRTHHEKNKNINTWTNTNKQTDEHKTTYISSYLRKAQAISPEVWAYNHGQKLYRQLRKLAL